MPIKKKHCRIWKNNKNNQKSALWSERRILSKKKLFYEVNSLGASSCKAGLLSNRGLKFESRGPHMSLCMMWVGICSFLSLCFDLGSWIYPGIPVGHSFSKLIFYFVHLPMWSLHYVWPGITVVPLTSTGLLLLSEHIISPVKSFSRHF